MKTTTLSTAAALHRIHMQAAEAALEERNIPVFHLHARLCNTIFEAVTSETGKDEPESSSEKEQETT